MTDQPDFINLNHTSFAKKEGYKPPQTTTLFSKKPKKRQRFVPGGEWADDSPSQPQEKPTIKTTPTTQTNPTFDLLNDDNNQEEAPKQKSSKFAFIKKSKKPKTKILSEETEEDILLSFEEIRSEKLLVN